MDTAEYVQAVLAHNKAGARLSECKDIRDKAQKELERAHAEFWDAERDLNAAAKNLYGQVVGPEPAIPEPASCL